MADDKAPLRQVISVEHVIGLLKWKADKKTREKLETMQHNLKAHPPVLEANEDSDAPNEMLQGLANLLREAVPELCPCTKKCDDGTDYICWIKKPDGQKCSDVPCGNPKDPCPTNSLFVTLDGMIPSDCN